MYCAIYKSLRKQDTYLYIAVKDDFTQIPVTLLQIFGTPVHVMDLELDPTRKLAQENILEVMQNLRERGWHLQMSGQEKGTKSH
jgi:uncharacterized protein YcgL (UPF0745 family)